MAIKIQPRFKAKIAQQGNSYVLRLPMEWVRVLELDARIKEDVEIEITDLLEQQQDAPRGEWTSQNIRLTDYYEKNISGAAV